MKAVGRPQKWTKMWRSGRKCGVVDENLSEHGKLHQDLPIVVLLLDEPHWKKQTVTQREI